MDDAKRAKLRDFRRWADALLQSMETALRTRDPADAWTHVGYRQFARKYNQVLDEVSKTMVLPPIIDRFNLERIRGPGDTLVPEQKALFEAVHANVSLLKSVLEGELGIEEDEATTLRDFFQARLRSAITRSPERERDIQDVIESLLVGKGYLKGLSYDREAGRVKVSSKEVIPDFHFPKLGLALEVKLTNSGTRVKEAIDEINADVAAYSKQYRRLLFVVYDLGFIKDVLEFARDLERLGNTQVIVVKH